MANDDAMELLEDVIKKIADNPGAVKVTKTVDELGALYSVEMDQRDAGMVIGREGSTINAIRTVIKTVAGKNKCAANIKLNIPDDPNKQRRAATTSGYSKPKQRFDDVEGQF